MALIVHAHWSGREHFSNDSAVPYGPWVDAASGSGVAGSQMTDVALESVRLITSAQPAVSGCMASRSGAVSAMPSQLDTTC